MEDKIAKILKWIKSTDVGIKETYGDISNETQLVDSHSTVIKQLELKIGHISTLLNQRKSGTLHSNIMPNLRSNNYYMIVTT